jgi:hypothetical protein
MDLVALRRTWGAYFSATAPPVARITLPFGLLSLVLCAIFAAHTWWTFRSFARISATVTENVSTQNAQGEVVSVTHLRFQLPGGRIVNFIDPVRSDDPSFATGEVVPVIYPAQSPESAQVATVWRLYFLACVLGIIGIVLADIGLILGRVRKRTVSA